jgi:FkbM family methyltransferase
MDVFIDPRFDDVYRLHPLVLVDVGARGGLKSNWLPAQRHLRLLGFEPDKREIPHLVGHAEPQNHSSTFVDVALHHRTGPLRLHVARDRGLTSIFEPNRTFLDSFPDADRFDITEIQQVEADTLDNQLRAHEVNDVDFIKADTQGSELFVLEGASCALSSSVFGLEVEVEFTPIYEGQPLFADVDHLLRGLGYLLFDLRPCYWKRAAGRGIGGPYGQIIWADALYLKSLPALREAIATLDPALRRSKLLRALSVSLLYGYYDYALEITRETGDVLAPDERATIEQRLRESGGRQGLNFPGRRYVAAALHRLWRLCLLRDDAWSVSRATLGNRS